MGRSDAPRASCLFLLLSLLVSLSACANVGALRELDDFGNIAEGEACHGIGTTVIDRYATSLWVVECGTGETNVGHVAHALIEFAR
jgi:hypothetical protein